jgi:type VI secretion system secreted protein VgrG
MPLANGSLSIDGTEYRLVSVAGKEAIGTHFRISARVVGTGEDDPKTFLGKPFELQLIPGGTQTDFTIKGVVLGVQSTLRLAKEELVFELGPEHELLAHGQNSYVYTAKSASDIVADVIERGGRAAAKWSAATPPVRDLCTQYRESDSAFIDRVVREDGVYWFYDHDSETTLTFADDASKAAAVAGSFLHRTEHGVKTDKAWVSSLRTRAVATTDKITTRDYDPQKPKLGLEGSAGDGTHEVYEWPAATLVTGNVKTRATTGLDALRARKLVVTGRSEQLSIRCGKVITIESSSLASSLEKLFIIAIEWSLGEGGNPLVLFTAVPSTTAFRLPLQPRTHASLGVETSWVRGANGQEIDVDTNGDTFVQPIWDRNKKKDDTVTIRSRSGQMQMGRSMTIPRIGWGMLVGHREGDVDRPWIVARLVDGTHPLPYKQPDNMTQTAWQTLTSKSDGTLSELVFEDKKDSEKMSIHAAKDMHIDIGNDEARVVGNNRTLEVDKDRTETTQADEKLTVTSDQTTTVKGDEAITVEGNRSLTIKGKEDTTISGKRAEAVTKDRTVDVGKGRTLTVSGTMAASSKKGFTREVLKKATMNATAGWTTEADGGLVTTTKGDASETIAAARTSNGKNGLTVAVKGDFKDTIAAAHTVSTTGGASESAKGKSKLTVGAAMTAAAPEIEIVGESEITIMCGASTVTIKSSEVSVKTAALAVAGPMVVLNGAQVKHNP